MRRRSSIHPSVSRKGICVSGCQAGIWRNVELEQSWERKWTREFVMGIDMLEDAEDAKWWIGTEIIDWIVANRRTLGVGDDENWSVMERSVALTGFGK